MFPTRGGDSEEVWVLSDNYPGLGNRVSELVLIRSVQEARLGRGGHVDAVQARTDGNAWVAILIQVEADRPWHGVRLSAAGVLKDRLEPSSRQRSAHRPRCRRRSRRGGRGSKTGPHIRPGA